MYQYKAYTLDKQIIEGTIDASSEGLAEERLHEAGYDHILTLKKSAPSFSLQRLVPTLYPVQKAEVVDFFNQLATLIDARVPFVQALWILSEQSRSAAFKIMINRIGQQVSGGVPFSRALAQYPKFVSGQYCQVIGVSEKSGDLPRGLRMVAGYMEKELATASSVKRTLTYPAFLGILSLIVIVVVAVIAMPSMITVFTALNADLPATTRIFIGIGDLINNYKFQLLGGVILVVMFFMWLWKTPVMKKLMDKVLIKIPVVSGVIIMRNLCRFCRTGSMLTEAGMTLPQSLNSVIGIIDNDIMRRALADVRQGIIKGKSLSKEMSNYPVFPRLLVDVIAIGEKTGTMQSSLTTMAEYYEKRLDIRMKKLTSMVEPASIIFVGLIISFIGISIMQPMYSIYQTLPLSG
jgi:type IV pilus assembly protein PilC